LIIGLNLAHDASVAVTDSNGIVHLALAEERISRKKNHIGVPRKSLQQLSLNIELEKVEKIVIGSHDLLARSNAEKLMIDLRNNPSNPEGTWKTPHPGATSKLKKDDRAPKKMIEDLLVELLPTSLKNKPIGWENHHDSHLGCAFGNVGEKTSILLSLDGEGDGESGAVALTRNGKINSLSRVPQLDSLGNLYSAVTSRYNFTPGKHEGKITGLAAFGSYSKAVDILIEHVKIKNGIPEILFAKDLKSRLTSRVVSRLGLSLKSFRTLEQIVDLAEVNTENYPDLAFAVQTVLEKSVTEIVDYWVKQTGISDISLAGGVFANVKLNQRISELESIADVKVFPNMGDGGIALGGIWANLSREGKISKAPLYNSMYLAPENEKFKDEIDLLSNDSQLMIENIDDSILFTRIAEDVAKNRMVAIHNGSMEFGPRALGNRTLLLDPRRAEILKTANERLKRTEFMPFAPIVLKDHFLRYFKISSTQSIQPFEYMTMTCDVNSSLAETIPAVVHVDNTARPQVVTESSNGYAHKILVAFFELTGIPLLVNTSLNVHEEPINYVLQDSIKALKSGAIDVIYTGNHKIELIN
jgi:carbamoyltransferase